MIIHIEKNVCEYTTQILQCIGHYVMCWDEGISLREKISENIIWQEG